MNWGILGAGNIVRRFLEGNRNIPDSHVGAIAARTRWKADQIAWDYGIPHVYASMESVIDDPAIDAIYIALPHALHKEWAIKAMKTGKAVLCEKPAVLNPAEMEEIIRISDGLEILYMEAMKTRFVPGFQKAMELIEQGAIGQVKSMTLWMCGNHMDLYPYHYLFQRGQGGALLDTGCYAIAWLLDLPEPEAISVVDAKVVNGIDWHTRTNLQAGDIAVSLYSAMDFKMPKRMDIIGTRGVLKVDDLHRPQKLILNGQEWFIPYDQDDFHSQIKSFIQTWKEGKTDNPIMPKKHSLKEARIIDAIKKQAAACQGRK